MQNPKPQRVKIQTADDVTTYSAGFWPGWSDRSIYRNHSHIHFPDPFSFSKSQIKKTEIWFEIVQNGEDYNLNLPV